MAKYKDVTGQKFGRLTALYKLHNYHIVLFNIDI